MSTAIFWPVLAMVLLTFIVWLRLYFTRVAFMKAERIHPEQLADRQVAAERLAPVNAPANNLQNLFEMPVLFYAAAPVIYLLDMATLPVLVVAWTFVLLRVVHSFIHLGANRVLHRFYAYFASSVVLALLWLLIALRLAGVG